MSVVGVRPSDGHSTRSALSSSTIDATAADGDVIVIAPRSSSRLKGAEAVAAGGTTAGAAASTHALSNGAVEPSPSSSSQALNGDIPSTTTSTAAPLRVPNSDAAGGPAA